MLALDDEQRIKHRHSAIKFEPEMPFGIRLGSGKLYAVGGHIIREYCIPGCLSTEAQKGRDMDIYRLASLLVESGLSNKNESDALIARFQDNCSERNVPHTVEAFCEFLVATNLFTEWQCDRLQMGKTKAFYLDNYLVLEQVGKDSETTSYKARDARDGKLVRLVVTPKNCSTGRQIEYRVEPYVG
jgi:hypothetical protein